MNKKDLAAFRRQFKVDSYSLKLGQLYSVYIKKDNQSILYTEHASFDMKSDAEQEIYLTNFKKLMTGSLNTKLFEMSFDPAAPEGEGQALCCRLLDAGQKEAFIACCDQYIAAITGNFNYDSDVVVSFAGGTYKKPVGRKSRKGEEESLDGFDDTAYGFKFILCSICKADSAKKGIYYSAATERFEISSTLDKLVNFTSPADGFVFPAFGDFGADVNKILYYTAKPNMRNDLLVETVLHCAYEPTAKEEQEKFGELLRLVSGEKIKPEVIKNLYESLQERIEAEEEAGESVTLDANELKELFEDAGVTNLDDFDDAFRHAADEGYAFKAASLVGSMHQIKIKSGVADISVNLEDLGSVRQIVNDKGRKCLQIELGEDAEINGLALETER